MGSTLDTALGTHITIDSDNIPADVVIQSDIADNSINNALMQAGSFAKITGIGTQTIDLDITDQDIVTGTTTGTIFGKTSAQKIGFHGTTPVIQQTSLTTAETSVTFVDENTPDFALASLKLHSDDTGAGFADLNEAQGFVEMCVNMQVRIGELETKLTALGLIA